MNVEELGVCMIKLRHKDMIARCRFFVVPGHGPALLGIPDTEFLGILKIMCNVPEGQQTDRKYDSETMEPSSALSCKVNTDKQNEQVLVEYIDKFIDIA